MSAPANEFARVTEEQQTFLFADLAGYTALTEAHGDRFAADAAREFCDGVRDLLPGFRADKVKTMGDAIMLRVPDAAAAVRLAVRIIEQAGRQHGALAVRVGIHTGSAVQQQGDWYGAGVNLSARVASAADPGEVLMTAATRELADAGLAGFQLQARGSQDFKNVADSVELYALTLAAQDDVADLPVDPVCRMAVDPQISSEHRFHDGVEYHFCTPECAQVFDRHPARYADQSRESSGDLIRVVIADDHKVVRRGLIGFLSTEADIEVVGEAGDGRQALDRLMALHAEGLLPDVVLMDLQMEPIDGVQATREIKSRFPTVEVVVLTSFVEEERVHAALDAGASGYVLKDADVDEVAGAIRAACRGEIHLDPAIAKRLMTAMRAPKHDDPQADLTERELEILRLVAAGEANKEIAAHLVISERTARTHVSNILRKLGLSSRTQAALWAVREGIAKDVTGA